MWILAAYFLIGIVVCVTVACSGEKRRDEIPLAMIFDPVWPLFFLWPLWVAVVLVERSFPKEERSAAAAVADPIGQVGVVVSALRPVGRIQIGAAHFDARSDGRIIPVGATVRVISRSMGEFLVKEDTRVWVHTCTLDHPAALQNYLSRGMMIFKTEKTEANQSTEPTP